MKTPWTMQDHNKGFRFKYRPVDIADANGTKLFRISNGAEGVLLAAKIVRSVNALAVIQKALRGKA